MPRRMDVLGVAVVGRLRAAVAPPFESGRDPRLNPSSNAPSTLAPLDVSVRLVAQSGRLASVVRAAPTPAGSTPPAPATTACRSRGPASGSPGERVLRPIRSLRDGRLRTPSVPLARNARSRRGASGPRSPSASPRRARILAEQETLGCPAGAALVVAGPDLDCLPVEASCGRGARWSDAGCAPSAVCPPGLRRICDFPAGASLFLASGRAGACPAKRRSEPAREAIVTWGLGAPCRGCGRPARSPDSCAPPSPSVPRSSGRGGGHAFLGTNLRRGGSPGQ